MSGSDYCREALPLEWLATGFPLCLGVSTFLRFYLQRCLLSHLGFLGVCNSEVWRGVCFIESSILLLATTFIGKFLPQR